MTKFVLPSLWPLPRSQPFRPPQVHTVKRPRIWPDQQLRLRGLSELLRALQWR